jgi:hypothetical protein
VAMCALACAAIALGAAASLLQLTAPCAEEGARHLSMCSSCGFVVARVYFSSVTTSSLRSASECAEPPTASCI